MSAKATGDKRVKRKLFSPSVFIITFIVFGILATIQMIIIGNYIDYKRMPFSLAFSVFVYWLSSSLLFTLFTRYQYNKHYQRPVDEFGKAAKKVAEGDFSVYVPPRHTADKMDQLDVIFCDFNKMVEALGSIETLKTDFFSDVSHEIKTPLAIIQNTAELLKNERLTDTQKEYADTIYQSSKRLSGLITNILRLNKLEKQTILPDREEYDLCAQLAECALQFESVWENKGIDFEADIEDSAAVTADYELMGIVWNNLLSNAFKFTGAGGAVKISQKTTDKEIVVTVSDTGCGMSRETVKHIFDKFYQGDTSHSTEGNGLGLALAGRVLELMNCTITVQSEINKGTEFTVHIPTEGEESDGE